MAKISQREKLLLGYASNSLSNSSSRRNSEVNFSDVFGGPPRRSSTHEFFQNEIGSTDCMNDDVEINADVDSDARFPSSWLELGEKPVFGDQIGVRNRYSSQDFFDDIFGGDQPLLSCSLPPRIHMPGRNPFSSAPGSRPVSPSRPLPPGVDPSATLSKLSVPGRTSSTEIMASTSINQSSKSSRRSISRLRQSSPNDLASFGKELTNNSKFNGTEYNAKPTMDSNENIQFHFSIYKWANKGVPIAMLSSKKRSPSRSKVEMITSERYLSSSKIDVIVNGASLSASKPRIQSNIQVRECKSEDAITKNVASDRLEGSKEVSDHSQKSLEQSSSKITKANFRSLSSLFREHKEENRKPSAVKGGKESMVNDETETRSYKVNKTKVHGIDTSSGENKDVDKSQGRTKVKNFVKVFNQHSCPNAGSQSRSWRWKDITSAATIEAESDGKTRQAKDDDEMQASFVSWGKTRSDSTREVDTISGSGSGSGSVSDTNASKSNKEPNKDVGESAPKFNVNCVGDNQQVNGVSEDSATESQEETQSYERKVKQWSKGKERNIRALLSTLQYVLWPNSGWKPIPLVDIIEANAVKKAYQRALLCLHPDKLQQKGAAPYQKLIAEKVFDILQEAWEQFNAIGFL